jgi:hypothetical protein
MSFDSSVWANSRLGGRFIGVSDSVAPVIRRNNIPASLRAISIPCSFKASGSCQTGIPKTLSAGVSDLAPI